MRSQWGPEDIIVLILACTVALVFTLEQTLPLLKEINLSENTVKFMNHGIGAMLALISMYIGARINNKNKKSDEG